jgi:hypothetical protein
MPGEIWSLLERLPRSFMLLELRDDAPPDPREPALIARLGQALPAAAPLDLAASCDAACRTGQGQTTSAPGVTIHITPIVQDSRTAGLLALGARTPADGNGSAAHAALAARVHGAGDALRQAFEQELGTAASPDDRTGARRLLGVLRFLSYLREVDNERELFAVVVQAAAVWYDVDAFAYRRTAAGKYVLDVSLPGAPASLDARGLPPAIAARLQDAPLLLSSAADLEALGWRDPAHDVLLLPMSTNGRPAWVLAVAGTVSDECQTTLAAVRTVLAAVLQRLVHRRAAAVEERLRQAFRGDTQRPEGVFAVLLEVIVESVEGRHGRLVMEAPEGEIQLAATGVAALEGETTAGGERFSVALPLARGTLRVEVIAAEARPFSPVAMLVIEEAAKLIQSWLV